MTTVLLTGGGTGGHLMPALAIAEATRALRPDWRFVFVGAKRGIEATILPERGLPHHLLAIEPLHRRQWWKNVWWLWNIRPLIREMEAILDTERPDLAIGTGGYASMIMTRAQGQAIPTAILELDVHPGTTNSVLAKRASEIWLAAPETVTELPEAARSRAVVTGAPITPPDPGRRMAARARFGLTDDRPVLVVTGGSQGSVAINRIVAAWLRDAAPGDVHVIWATGRGSHAEFVALHRPPAVQVIPFLDPMADAWAVADLCVARAGSMTLAELCAWGIPSILIPLPTAAADHQTRNARALENAGAARMLLQEGLDAATFGRTVTELLHDARRRSVMAEAARARGRPNAAATIALRVVALAERSS